MAYGAEARRAVANGEPTPKQKLLLRAIWELTLERGFPPSFKEIAERVGEASTAGITEGLNRLQKAGWLVRENLMRRSMRLTRKGVQAAGIDPVNPFIAEDPKPGA